MGKKKMTVHPRIYITSLRQDDPKKNTSLKLARHSMALIVKRIPRNTLLLNPLSENIVSPQDKELIAKAGITVLDGSWRKILPLLKRRVHHPLSRRLPLLKAANPINYGKFILLSSVEALAASLYITGFEEEAIKLLSIFKWGPTFLELNKNFLELYRATKNTKELLELECRILETILPKHVNCNKTTIPYITLKLLEDMSKES